MEILDGMQPLLGLFENDEQFIKHFAKNTLFFEPETVNAQIQDLFSSIANGERIPVRYSKKFRDLYSVDSKTGKDITKIKGIDESISLSKNYPVLHKETQVLIVVDKDGNKAVRDTIKKYTRNTVSQGRGNTLINYTISHIWAKTENPYFYTSLWNICLVPEYLSFILDKPGYNGIILTIKNLIKSICVLLYDPIKIMNNKILIEKPDRKSLELAQSLLDKNIVKFVKDNKYYCEDGIKGTNHNKDFILTLLEYLKMENIITDDVIHSLTNRDFCKNTFGLQFELLRELNEGLSNDEIKSLHYESGHERYYSKDIFQYKNKKYLVCNHWYEEQRGKFIKWAEKNKQ